MRTTITTKIKNDIKKIAAAALALSMAVTAVPTSGIAAHAEESTAKTIDFSYTGDVQAATLNKGTYKLEVWGAQGGYRSSSTYGGKGGYSVGTLKVTEKTEIYIYVGGSGNTGAINGGFNGGGKRNTYNGGGGASDIRIGTDSLYARVIVAGGGGSDGATNKPGGAGGGTSGISVSSYSFGTGGFGGTQTGNTNGSGYSASTQSTSTTASGSNYAGFGFGGNGVNVSSGYGGAGGGGWYGGVGGYPDGSGDDDKGGGGGSGYVYTSDTASTAESISGWLLDSRYYLTDASTTAGNVSLPSPTGSSETGHAGDGYARITYYSGTVEWKEEEENDKDTSKKYTVANEPLHTVTFTKKSSYDKSTLDGAVFHMSGTSDNGTAYDEYTVSGVTRGTVPAWADGIKDTDEKSSLTAVFKKSSWAEDDAKTVSDAIKKAIDGKYYDKDTSESTWTALETGSTTFKNIETGTYILEEISAPDGYEKDSTKHVVTVNSDGTFTIEGLSKTGSTYDLYNTKKADKKVTVTKIWKDGITNHSPLELAMTITTGVVEKANRTFSIVFDAVGGTFGNGKTTNTVRYNAKNEPTEGLDAQGNIPSPTGTNPWEQLSGWVTSKTSEGTDKTSSLTPTNPANSYLSGLSGDANILYARYEDTRIYYAVSPYKIDEDGITFGPATGNMFSSSYSSLYSSLESQKDSYVNVKNKYAPMLNAHKINDKTYLINDQSILQTEQTEETEETVKSTDADGNVVYNYTAVGADGTPWKSSAGTAPAGSVTVTKEMAKADMDARQDENSTKTDFLNAIVGDDAGYVNSSGASSAAKQDGYDAYRCIHYDNWNTIKHWCKTNPHVYDKCVTNHCSVRLTLYRNSSQNKSYMNSWYYQASTKNAATGISNGYYVIKPETGETGDSEIQGDGASAVGTSVWSDGYCVQLSPINSAHDQYSASLIRARLVGADSLTATNKEISLPNTGSNGRHYTYTDSAGNKYDGNRTYGYPADSSDALVSMFETALGSGSIKERTLRDTVNSSVSNTKSYQDKIWLFSYEDIWNEDSTYGHTTNQSRLSLSWRWLSTRGGYYGDYYGGVYDYYYAYGVDDYGYVNGRGSVDRDGAVGPGFILSR